MRPICYLALAGMILAGSGVAADADQLRQNATQGLKTALEMLDKGDEDRALEEATWARDYIQQLVDARKLAAFPREVDGLELTDISNNTAMGVNVIEATYGDSEVKVTLTKFGGGNNPLGALAGFAGMMGGSGKFRAGRFTAIENEDGDVILNTDIGTAQIESSNRHGPDLRRFVVDLAKKGESLFSGR